MAQFDPTPSEISAIERIETVYYDNSMEVSRRTEILQKLWRDLERLHGDTVLMLKSPEGDFIFSPFQTSSN